MRRIWIVVGIILIAMAAWFYVEHESAQRTAANRQMFDVVMSEKMDELYHQAQDWSKPVQLNVRDARLTGDYKVLSEFLLNYWMRNVETRNQYLRQLKAVKWDQFLDVNRLDADRKHGYTETENMLKVVHQVTEQYQKQNFENKKAALAQAKSLPIDRDIRNPLQAKLEQNLKVDQDNSLVLLELEILTKADAMFEMLKKYPWQQQGDKILFAQDAQVKQFNALYQDILRLNLEIEQKKKQNMLAVQQE